MRRTLAHVSAATDLAPVLLAFRVYASLEVEEAGGKEFGGVGDDLVELIGKAVVLKRASSINAGLSAPYDKKKRTHSQDGLDEDRVGVGKAEKGSFGGVGASLDSLDAALHRWVLSPCPGSAPGPFAPQSKLQTHHGKDLESSLDLLACESELMELDQVCGTAAAGQEGISTGVCGVGGV